jgi:hypothetical protein
MLSLKSLVMMGGFIFGGGVLAARKLVKWNQKKLESEMTFSICFIHLFLFSFVLLILYCFKDMHAAMPYYEEAINVFNSYKPGLDRLGRPVKFRRIDATDEFNFINQKYGHVNKY